MKKKRKNGMMTLLGFLGTLQSSCVALIIYWLINFRIGYTIECSGLISALVVLHYTQYPSCHLVLTIILRCTPCMNRIDRWIGNPFK